MCLIQPGFVRLDCADRGNRNRRPPGFAPSSETPGGYVGQAVLENLSQRFRPFLTVPLAETDSAAPRQIKESRDEEDDEDEYD